MPRLDARAQSSVDRRCRRRGGFPFDERAELTTGETLYIDGGYHIID